MVALVALWQRRMPLAWLIAIAAVSLALATGAAWMILNQKRLEFHIALVDSRPTATPAPVWKPADTILTASTLGAPTATHPAPTPSVHPTEARQSREGSTTELSVSAVALLSQADAAYQSAIGLRDRAGLLAGLALLTQAETADRSLSVQAAALRSRIGCALAALDNTVYLDGFNTSRWDLVASDGKPLINPIDFTIGPAGIYVIDSGAVYSAPLSAMASVAKLALAAVLTPTAWIGGFPVKEVLALDASNADGTLFVLDKSGDVYRYSAPDRAWRLESLASNQMTNPDPGYLNIATYNQRLYLLDPARNQVWRHPPAPSMGFLPGKLPWLLKSGEPDVSAGLDLAVDGDVFVLRRDGLIDRYFLEKPSYKLQMSQFSLAAADGRSHIVEMESAPSRPVAIFASDEEVPLYIADPGRRRVIVLHRETGAFLRQLAAPANPDFSALHGIAEWNSRLYMLAGPRLYSYDTQRGITNTLPLTGQLPVWQSLTPPDPATLRAADLAPNDPRMPALLATYHFTMPIKAALLPDRPAIYPGARRSYRYGVHEGLDLYEKDVGAEITIGTPVYAAGAGMVVRADRDYTEMSLAEVNSLLDEAHARHNTLPETLNRLGGRQIWIDHGNGVSTRYLHLDGISQGITVTAQVVAGQLIGYVGLSGTPDGIVGDTQWTHLHFEIRIGRQHEYFLGQWLTIEDARRAYELILDVPVRPAFLEFRQGDTK
jgi:murein DD-endopeptidase MepM/ murein hydrolase activator NlpD